jgi:hypothetical protein
MVSMELPLAVTGFAAKLVVTLDGAPETLRVTELLAPTAVTVTAALPLDLRLTEIDAGAEIVKSAGTVTVKATRAALWVRPPPLPVMVSE